MGDTVRVHKKGICDKKFNLEKDVKQLGNDVRLFQSEMSKDDDGQFLYVSRVIDYYLIRFNGYPFRTNVKVRNM